MGTARVKAEEQGRWACSWLVGGSEGQEPETRGWGLPALSSPIPWDAVTGFLPPQALLPMPEGTWLFMEGEGSLSSSRKPPEPGRFLCRTPVYVVLGGWPQTGHPHLYPGLKGVVVRVGQASLKLPAQQPLVNSPPSAVLEAVLGGSSRSCLLLSLPCLL